MQRSLATLLTFLGLTIIFVSSAQSIRDLPTGTPEASGIPARLLVQLDKEFKDSMPSLGSFIIWRKDKLVYEKYYHRATNETVFGIKSITKSIVSALAGIAKAKQLLPDLNTPVLNLYPEFAKPLSATPGVWFANDKAWMDSVRKTLTLKNLLTMQTGWEWSDFGPVVGVFINAADPVRFTMDIPFEESPGTRFNYCSAATSLFSAALSKSIKEDLVVFANRNLFGPTGMTLSRWDVDPVGRYVGASEMFMTSRDLLRFGLLYLKDGKVDDKQVIPSEWIRESTNAQAVLNYWDILPNANGYGYFWWRRKTNGHQAWVASGAEGQVITIIPSLDMVIVANNFLGNGNRGREELKRIHLYINRITRSIK